MNYKKLFFVVSVFLCTIYTESLYAQHYTYVNYSPDIRYSTNKIDSRINFDCKTSGYSYGNNFGRFEAWTESSIHFISFDYMAVADLSRDLVVGKLIKSRSFQFKVVAISPVKIFGKVVNARKVEVTKNDVYSNSYLYADDIGVVAISVVNFDNHEIPNLFFILEESNGLFSEICNHSSNGMK